MRLSANLRRGEQIYSRWKAGATIRATSDELGIPEGSVGYYYRKFNKHVDKFAHRYESTPQKPSQPPSMPKQLVSAIKMKDVRDRYHGLIKEGRYHQAKAYLESLLLFDKIMSQLSTGLEGGDPKIYGPILLTPEQKLGEDRAAYVARALAHLKAMGIWP